MLAVVHVVEGARCHVVWDNYFLFWFSGYEGARTSSGDKKAIRCDGCVSYEEPYFLFLIWGLERDTLQSIL